MGIVVGRVVGPVVGIVVGRVEKLSVMMIVDEDLVGEVDSEEEEDGGSVDGEVVDGVVVGGVELLTELIEELFDIGLLDGSVETSVVEDQAVT